MMHVSKTAGYAIFALSCIENANSQPRFIRDIAKTTGLRKPYLAKIINQLAHDGLVVAKRGYRGGITLARPPERISLLQIVRAIEGQAEVSPCLFGLESCCPARRVCPAHAPWNEMRMQIEALLAKTTLAAFISATQPLKPVPADGKKPAVRKSKTAKEGSAASLLLAC